MATYMTFDEAAERAGLTMAQLKGHMDRQQIRRYVLWEDVELALAATGEPGKHASRCAQHPKQHWWNPRLTESDDITGEPLYWCGRKGCTVGVVMAPDRGRNRPMYRHRHG